MGKIGSPDYSAVVNKFLFHQNTLGVSPFPNISTFTFFFLPENVSKESCKECLQKAQKVASQNFIFYFNFCVFCFAFFTVVSLIPYFSRAAQMRLRITKLLLSAFFFVAVGVAVTYLAIYAVWSQCQRQMLVVLYNFIFNL